MNRLASRLASYRWESGVTARIQVRGELVIEPALKWCEIKKSRFALGDHLGPDDPGIMLLVASEDHETDEGVNTVISCSRVIPWSRSPYDPGDLAGDVRELCAELEGHSVTGEMTLYDTDMRGDLRRVIVRGGEVSEDRARMMWSDGTPVAMPY